MSYIKGDSLKRTYRTRIPLQNATGLLIRSSENVLTTNEVSTRKLWYELIAPRSYMVKRICETPYLLKPALHIEGSGYVHFNPNPSNAGYNARENA